MRGALDHPASYRDPDGFLFYHENRLYRQVNKSYRQHYQKLMESGLYRRLTDAGMLIQHKEVDIPAADPESAWKVICPEFLSFISYPYGWSFSAFKKAALLTLDIQEKALEVDLWLKDASAFNIQYRGIHPVFIDSLSFTAYQEGEPWPAYRQFCEQFLAPLALSARKDPRLTALLALHVDGIPLDLATKLLPYRSLLSPGLLIHLFLHSRMQKDERSAIIKPRRRLLRHHFQGILHSLRRTVENLDYSPSEGVWSDYYCNHSYTPNAFTHKKEIVEAFLKKCAPGKVLDLGANTGFFSRMAARNGNQVVAADADSTCTELNFRYCEKEGVSNVLPLTVDILNPVPATGFENTEHASFTDRMSCDTMMALALLHHLRIRGNLPFFRFADLAAAFCTSLIVEFVPRTDPVAVLMLKGRVDAFPDYSKEGFEDAFKNRFIMESSVHLNESGRILYLFRLKS